MTTAGDAILAAINTNWNVGSGGTKPARYSTEDSKNQPGDNDYIRMLNWTYKKYRKRRAEDFVALQEVITFEVVTKNDANKEERLDTMVTELYRIITPDNVTGYHMVDIVHEDRSRSDKTTSTYGAYMTVQLDTYSTDSAVTPGSAANTYIDELLMYGSGNAAWVPCAFGASSTAGKVRQSGNFFSNVDSTNIWTIHTLGEPTNRGGLKLYVTGLKVIVYDADAAAYINDVWVMGINSTGATELMTDTTNRQAQGSYEYAMSDTDCSSYDSVLVALAWVVDAATELDIATPLLQCFYDT